MNRQEMEATISQLVQAYAATASPPAPSLPHATASPPPPSLPDYAAMPITTAFLIDDDDAAQDVDGVASACASASASCPQKID